MLQPNETWIVRPDVAGAAQAAAEQVTELLFKQPNHICVALAGGRTPAAMYQLLTRSPCRDRIPWNTIDWFWGDERCVPPNHSDSNYRMAMETLLGPLGIREERIHRMPADATDLDAAARAYEQTIRDTVPAAPAAGALPGGEGQTTSADARTVPQFDLILLGIGADGHTASLFPGSTGLAEREHLVVAHHAPGPNAMRMTMTYPLLWSARHIFFLACGADKAEAMKRILSDPRTPESPPTATVRSTRGHITWILDTAAARLIASP